MPPQREAICLCCLLVPLDLLGQMLVVLPLREGQDENPNPCDVVILTGRAA